MPKHLIVFCFFFALAAHATSAWGIVAANTQIIAQAHLSYYNGSVTRTDTSSVSVIVGLIAAAPAIATGLSQTAANASAGTSVTDSFIITTQSNGPDAYTLSATVTGSTNTSGATATPDVGSVALGATITIEGSTSTLLVVPADGMADNSVNGIEAGDTVVVGGESRTVQSVTDNAEGTSTMVLSTALPTAPGTGVLAAERKTVTVTATVGTVATAGTDVTVSVSLSATSASAPGVTTTSGVVSNTFLNGLVSFGKYVRNVTAPSGNGTAYTYNATSYFSTGVTAKPGDILEYLLVAANTGTGPVTAAVVSDALPTGYVSLNTGGYSGSKDVAYVDETGAASYLTSAVDSDTAVFATPTLSVNAGTGATNNAGGTIAVGKSILVLYQATVNSSAQGDKIVSSGQLSSPDMNPATSTVTVTGVVRTSSVITMLNHAPSPPAEQQLNVALGAYRSGSATGPFVNLSAPVPVGSTTPIDLSQPVPVNTATQHHQGDPLFISVTDLDQNLDTAVAETTLVTVSNTTNSDMEVVRLTETGQDTGVFAGYLPTVSTEGTASANGLVDPYNGVLSIDTEDHVTARYVDSMDGTDASAESMMVDPYGIVLDTSTGLPVSGATITIQTTAGGTVTVYGDDGVSTFPSTVTSGGTASDSSGRSYSFPVGEYRFPFLVPGNYRFLVTPPAGYGFPSSVATATIQALSNGPFAIIPGSRGEDFVIHAGSAVRIDIPIDPYSSSLWLQKSAAKEFAGHGDFIPYRLTLTNGDATVAAAGVQVVDRLPSGFRLRKGSIRIDGVAGSNPVVSADGRSLTFTIGTLAGGATLTIDYVAEVTVGAGLGTAVNSAAATTASGIRSNTASATVTIRDDFQRTRSVLMGRVTTGDCDALSGEGAIGVEGVRIYLEDGTFVVSDKRGLFHFEGVSEGLHVVQLDIDSLPDGYEPYACTENSRFAGRAFSQFVETRGGALWRVDFHIRLKPAPENDMPAGANTVSASTEQEDESDADREPTPVVQGQSTTTEKMPDIRLRQHFPSMGSRLSARERKKLDGMAGKLSGLEIEKILVTGYSDSHPIARGRGGRYKTNQALSLARAKSVGHYLMDKLHVPPEKLYITGKGSKAPVAANRTKTGRARNRRVEVYITASRIVENSTPQALPASVDQKRTEAAMPQAAPAILPVATAEKAQAVAPQATPKGTAVDATKTPEGVTIKDQEGILSPLANDILVNSINGVRICLDSRLTPRLFVDDNEVKADRIGFTMKDEKARKTLYSYIGVDFGKSGNHTLRMEGLDPFGNIRFKQGIDVKRSGEIASIRLKAADGNVADGKTPVKMRLEIYDADGTAIPAEVDLEIREGTLSPLKRQDTLVALPETSGKAHVHMSRDGEVLFQPLSASGPYRVVLAYNDVTLEAETYVQPKMRDWILVGLAEGTAGYNTVTGNMESLNNAGGEDDLYENGRVALYAKGQIKGKWLLTMAYDSDKKKADNTSGLFQTINPDTYYTLYGDGSQQLYDASSGRKLYIKMEREHFYAMFGDFDTGMTVTELSRYSRRMTGIKTELQHKNFEVNAFASETDQIYLRDEIPGDGTSGIYRLSSKNIMPNTEKITIEVRDRFQSEKLVSSRAMTRFIDYSIDYDSSAVIFKEPIYGKDENFNPIIIVAEYECMADSGQDYTYGGRAGVKLFDNKLKAGGTYVHEGQGERDSDLYGVDTTVKLDQATTLRAEIATSDYDDGVESRSGNAYLAEVSRRDKKIDAKAYYREQETGFGLGQQPGSEAGTRKFGVEGVYRLKGNLDTKGNAYRQYNLETDATRDVAEARLNYTDKGRSTYIGFLHAEDQLDDGSNRESNQVTLGGKVPTLYKRLSLTMDYAQSIGDNENSDFPTRVVMGAEYQATKSLTLLAAQEFTWGEDTSTQDSRLGMRSGLWQGASLTSGLERQLNENDERVLASAGLKQTWQINASWKVDAGVERSHTLSESYYFNTNVEPASGSHEDYTAVSGGATYQVKQFIWDNRVEFRLADSEDKWGVMSGLVKEIDDSKAFSGRVQVFQTDTDASTGTDTTKADLRLGLVYRPEQTKWVVLDRLDFIVEKQDGDASTNFSSWRLINNALANYRPRKDLQLSLHYGAKYVRETIYENDYSGYTDFFGAEGRYDINKKWDIGLHGSIFHSWHGGQFDYCEGTSVGYNVVENAWISLGYNFSGFKDRDFSRANFTSQGPFIRFRLKFDQNSVREAATWLKNS